MFSVELRQKEKAKLMAFSFYVLFVMFNRLS